ATSITYSVSPMKAVYTPVSCARGTDTITFHATGSGSSSNRTQGVVIDDPTFNPVVSPAAGALAGGQTGVAYNQSITTSVCNAIVTYTLIGTLPPGLSLSAGGVISGNPTTVGPYSFTVRASYPGTHFTDTAYSINVTLGP